MRENELLEHIYRANPQLPPGVTIPPGDDMAAVRLGDAQVLISVDQLADGTHFHLENTPLKKIGCKAVTRALSDVAAMAADPLACVIAAALPDGFAQQDADRVFDAARQTALDYHCPLIGGDILIAKGHRLTLSVTVLAHCPGNNRRPITRAGSSPGDAVCVTGNLGGSLESVDGYTHHLDFEPQLPVARELAQIAVLQLHAMIDLSDGLAADLPRLCHAATPDPLRAVIELDKLPISPAAHAAAAKSGREPWQHALGDGEDYELCFTLPAEQADAHLPHDLHGVPITRIGTLHPLTDEPNTPILSLQLSDGSTQPVENLGWEHKGAD